MHRADSVSVGLIRFRQNVSCSRGHAVQGRHVKRHQMLTANTIAQVNAVAGIFNELSVTPMAVEMAEAV